MNSLIKKKGGGVNRDMYGNKYHEFLIVMIHIHIKLGIDKFCGSF